MDREERLRRRRERYRIARERETPEQREERLRRNREYMRRRRAAMTPEQRQTERRRNSHQDSTRLPTREEPPSFDDPGVVRKMTEFHNDLLGLQASRCTVCVERFPSICVDTTSICKRCCNDKRVPKLYSADNNMDPGPVPLELTVSVQ